MTATHDSLRTALRRFMAGESSRELAAEIEVALDDLFPEDPRFEDLAHALASYRPGGGEFLYDDSRVRPLCETALGDLEDAAPSGGPGDGGIDVV